jgi:glycerol uptake facilitator-like aquaporin
MTTLRQRVLAEFLGTATLLMIVVGSGHMGESLASGNAAIALLANSTATGLPVGADRTVRPGVRRIQSSREPHRRVARRVAGT